jgi:serine/threonine protein phosphatase 1
MRKRFALKTTKHPTEGQLLYAFGDIHGRYDLLVDLLEQIRPDVDQRARGRRPILIFCGDYIDRGADSSRVIQALCCLSNRVDLEVHALQGNHEAMLMAFIEHPEQGRNWLRAGGAATLSSYGIAAPAIDGPDIDLVRSRDQLLRVMPAAHIVLISNMTKIMTIGDFVFVHAGLDPTLPIGKQNAHDPLWIGAEFRQHRGSFGKTVIHGHSWSSSKPDIRSNRIGLDTGAYETSTLTCLCLDSSHKIFFQTSPPLTVIPPQTPSTYLSSSGHKTNLARETFLLAQAMNAVGDELSDVWQTAAPPEAFDRYSTPRVRNVPVIAKSNDSRATVAVLAIVIAVLSALVCLSVSLSGEIRDWYEGHGFSTPIASLPHVALKRSLPGSHSAKPITPEKELGAALFELRPSVAKPPENVKTSSCKTSASDECRASIAAETLKRAYSTAAHAHVSAALLRDYKDRWNQVDLAMKNDPAQRARAFSILSRNLLLEASETQRRASSERMDSSTQDSGDKGR